METSKTPQPSQIQANFGGQNTTLTTEVVHIDLVKGNYFITDSITLIYANKEARQILLQAITKQRQRRVNQLTIEQLKKAGYGIGIIE